MTATTATLPDFDGKFQKVNRPAFLAHVVLRSNNRKEMVKFYTTCIGASISFENEFMTLMSYDEEHHRLAVLQLPDVADKQRNTCGLEHIAFTFLNLGELLLAYRQRKAKGYEPFWCVNHGPTTSFYYYDPDGNIIETQVDNFSSADEATEYMKGEAYMKNPIGITIDPEDLIQRMRNGESDEHLRRRDESGPIAIPP